MESFNANQAILKAGPTSEEQVQPEGWRGELKAPFALANQSLQSYCRAIDETMILDAMAACMT
ncbi:hypothetical protein IFM47457_00913 [Aspergillus lentulus]|nr:hypothetical protein IFM47457_00913 [Aspergillus lentulus]